MIYDFSKICKTYDKNSYTKECFSATPCPKCRAVGKFNLHGHYSRDVIYFEKREFIQARIEIKRVKCRSCKSTHAVMPGDIIPYKLLSLFAVIFILSLSFIKKTPVLKIAALWDFSFQFIYSCLGAFTLYKSRIHQYFLEVSPELTPPRPDSAGVLALIREPYTNFQRDFIPLNHQPCFMIKFFNKPHAPPVGLLKLVAPPRGRQHNT